MSFKVNKVLFTIALLLLIHQSFSLQKFELYGTKFNGVIDLRIASSTIIDYEIIEVLLNFI